MAITTEQIDHSLQSLPFESIREMLMKLSTDLASARAFAAAWKRVAKTERATVCELARTNVKLRAERAELEQANETQKELLARPVRERLCDLVRDYAVTKFIAPARAAGDPIVLVNPLDIHSALGLRDRYCSVVSALSGRHFLKRHNLKIRSFDRIGQMRTIVYELGPKPEE